MPLYTPFVPLATSLTFLNSGNTLTVGVSSGSASNPTNIFVGATAGTVAQVANIKFGLPSNGVLSWNNNTDGTGGGDIGISRVAAGIAQFNNGTANNATRWYVWAGTARVTTQFDKANNTLADITGLSINLLASRVYIFEAVLYTTSNVAAGVKFAISGTAGVTAIIYEAVVNQTGVDVGTGTQRTTTLGTAVGDITAVTTAYARITGTWSVSTAGTMTVQFAQNATNAANSSVLVGSSLKAFDVT